MKQRIGFIGLATVLLWPAQLDAQWWDAQMPRRGELQIGLSGRNSTIDHRFTADGSLQPLSDVFGAELDSRLVPPVDSLDTVLAAFFPTLGLLMPEASTLGDLQYDALLERTFAPISLNFGVTDWLAAFAVVPMVEGKSFVATQLDSLAASAGSAGTAFANNPDSLFQQLNSGISELEAIVAADTLSVALQAEAEQLLSDARTYEVGMLELRQQPYVPTDSGAAGRELSGFYQDLQSGFLAFEIDLPVIPLAGPITTAQAVGLTSGPEFGIEPPQSRSTGIKLGDIEVGVSIQPLNSFRQRPGRPRPKVPIRAKLDALYRFATGSPPAPNRLFDVGTGDGQPDVEFRTTFDVAYGSRFWLSLLAGYNIQLEAEVDRLITSPVSPVQPGAYTATVLWNPGNVLTLVAAPRFNLTPVITFSGLITLTRHGRDQVQPLGPVDSGAVFLPEDIEEGTRWNARSLGFAARYSTTNWSGDRRSGIPVEVELSYLHTTSGSDGFAPQRNVWQVSLRYYQRIFR